MFLLCKIFHSFSSIQYHITFMHDNACPHSAAITRQVLATNDVNVSDCPASSPDLSLIEQVWDKLGHCVWRNHAKHTVNDLAVALQAEWANLLVTFIQCYVNSMRRRITACISQNGGHMRYWHVSLNLQSLFFHLIPLQMNLK